MASFNKVILAGNLTRAAEMRYLPSGIAIAETGIAVNTVWKTENGEKKERVCFIDCVIWGKSAENFIKYTRKGSPVLIEGELRFEQWETDGEKHSKHVVNVDRFQFLERKEDGEQTQKPNK